MQTLREAGRKPKKEEESKFLDETIEDRSPTPGSQQEEAEDRSLPSSPSPPPAYLGVDGNMYREGTLNLMATAPSHLQKSSDVLVLEEFFGTEQLTKLDMFKKQVSCDNLMTGTKESPSDGLPQIAEEAGLRPGVSMPNISTPPTSSSLLSYPETRDKKGQVKLRLAKNNRLSDANRMSYDIASEMEQLRARLQETAKQELADFDRKYSPKLHHSNMISAEANHSRQSSLDSSIPHQKATTPTLSALKGGHSRQHSLPIDPKFLRQMQNQQSNEPAPSLATTHKSGQSPSLGGRHALMDRGQSPPLLFGHIRQISGGSMSSDGGAFSPPLTPTEGHVAQNNTAAAFPGNRPPPRSSTGAGSGLPIQQFKQSNPPGMARISSDGAYNRRAYGSNNSLSRMSPEGEGNGGSRGRSSSSTQQPHYSTSVIKRGGKRGSLEITAPPSVPHPQYGGGGGVYKYEEKVANGRPSAYEQPKRRSYGEDIVGNGGIGRFSQVGSPPRMMEGNLPASPKLSRLPDRRSSESRQQLSTGTTNPYSRLHHARSSEPLNQRGVNPPNNSAPGHAQEQEIEPYMTSKQVKSQMQNFNYTPFSQQRSYTVSGGDAPKLTKKPKSAKNTWI